MPAIHIETLSRAAFAPFGDVIMLDGARHYPINEGTTERYHALTSADTGDGNGQTILSLFRAQPRAMPLEIRVMERHPLGSQAFVPMTHDPLDEYLVVVAPAGDFRPEGLRAFLCRGFQGVNYAKGVWHHPLIALHKLSDFIVMDRIGQGHNCDELSLATDLWLTEAALKAARKNQVDPVSP
ncbi:ureidoglycolate lyase [Undibacterium sp. Jales W-56]|uniref:ureidoglycolate lyase n=1 Tax=Undibacterium sp. Jales W-56 TaxID=2897325 RepID=UPI0021D2E367|nr:ureidoglycolate lyase [Undibacterium sp. Jales W-56]MCU6434875.1 ureidoglycolate lyase [Undibacterium sp. Jales W-56]